MYQAQRKYTKGDKHFLDDLLSQIDISREREHKIVHRGQDRARSPG